MTALATWLPIPPELETKSRVYAVKEYRKLDHRLANGERVMPTLRTALNIIDNARELGLHMPVAISEGSYYLRADIEAEEKLKEERFAHFCKMDGHDGTREERNTCGTCDREGVLGTMYYRPDSRAYPTPVLFECYTCRPKK